MTSNGARVFVGFLAMLSLCAGSILPWSAALADDSPESIMERTRATYAALHSYADTGVVLVEYDATTREQHTFSTSFSRSPRGFLLDFHKNGGDRYVVWGDPDAFHTWWKTIGAQSDYPNPSNTDAINLSEVQTEGAITKITTLLYPKASLVGSLSNFADLVLDGSEAIGGQPCYRLIGKASDVYTTGNEVNLRKVTVWIDKRTLLVRQIREEPKALPGHLDRTTTTFEPVGNPTLAASRFAFTPPQSE